MSVEELEAIEDRIENLEALVAKDNTELRERQKLKAELQKLRVQKSEIEYRIDNPYSTWR